MSLSLVIDNLEKSYSGLNVLNGFTARLAAPNIYCLMAPSGTGKTTLFRLIMGLEQPDGGSLSFCGKAAERPVNISAVFQEDRLIAHLSPIENIALALPGKADRKTIQTELQKLLPEESLNRPVSTLSGGMKRRCAFLRAVMPPSDLVIMDEPFTGLDEEAKDNVIRYLLSHQRDRLFLIASHDPGDAKKLNAIRLSLEG